MKKFITGVAIALGVLIILTQMGERRSSKPMPRGCGTDISNCSGVTTDLVKIVASNGYTCRTPRYVTKNLFGRGFTIRCNDWTYTYEIEDIGGRWTLVDIE